MERINNCVLSNISSKYSALCTKCRERLTERLAEKLLTTVVYPKRGGVVSTAALVMCVRDWLVRITAPLNLLFYSP